VHHGFGVAVPPPEALMTNPSLAFSSLVGVGYQAPHISWFVSSLDPAS
jgi:hypothetical protein